MAEEDVAEETKKGSKLKIIIPLVILLAGIGGAGYFLVIAPKAQEKAAATSTTEPHGKIVRLEPITMNLSDGHILKVGIAMEMVAEPKDTHLNALVGLKANAGGGHGSGGEEKATMTLDGLESKALDQTITVLGNDTYDGLSSPSGRAAAKKELSEKIIEAYHGDVKGVLFTDFVMS